MDKPVQPEGDLLQQEGQVDYHQTSGLAGPGVVQDGDSTYAMKSQSERGGELRRRSVICSGVRATKAKKAVFLASSMLF